MDPRDVAAAQDRAARLAALGARVDLASRLTELDEPLATTERPIVGYYRGQPIYKD
jgi:hypothetical protein